jgi:cytochrome d ubiquinol oxidase subunit I
VQYWSMRVMAYLGSLLPVLALWGLWAWRRGSLARSRVFLFTASWAVFAPFIMNTAGWMLTENGRQPWIVQGLQLTADGNSPSVSTAEVVISITTLAATFIAVGVVWVVLMTRYARRDLPPDDPDSPDSDQSRPEPALVY